MTQKDISPTSSFTLESVQTFITRLGFPIFAALMLGYFVWHNETFLRELISDQNEERRQMIQVMEKQNAKLNEILIKMENLK